MNNLLPSSHQIGDEVVTTGGVHGRVTGVAFRELDFGDGWGIGHKVMYDVLTPKGVLLADVRSEYVVAASKIKSVATKARPKLTLVK